MVKFEAGAAARFVGNGRALCPEEYIRPVNGKQIG